MLASATSLACPSSTSPSITGHGGCEAGDWNFGTARSGGREPPSTWPGQGEDEDAKFAAALLEAHEDDIVFENGKNRREGIAGLRQVVRGSRRLCLTCRCAPAGLDPGLSEEAFFSRRTTPTRSACHISMLEIDRERASRKLLKLVAVMTRVT